MSNSRYEYVRSYEQPDNLLPNTFLLLRIDGHAFHKFSDQHRFTKPNDLRALELMDRAAKAIMNEYPDVVLGFGESDEYSFLIRRAATMYSRRESKIVSLLVSLFTSAYTFHWPEYFPPTDPALLASGQADPNKLLYPPTFDGRIVCYPSPKEVRDYFSWRQVDTHINNLYNTTFWALIQLSDPPLTPTQAHKALQGSFSKDKNEILFSRFGINYSKLDERYRKGSILIREESKPEQALPIPPTRSGPLSDLPSVDNLSLQSSSMPVASESESATVSTSTTTKTSSLNLTEPRTQGARKPKKAQRATEPDGTRGPVVVLHVDLIKDEFWLTRPWLLA
ncbi:trnahis guanylyltransferase [Phaffia rhodozyma]|uniref:tRNA(His) guanylyltransferase n=1 Tax=Phaffia rhodozyma TaxID=264483 RepID=A0A0F7SHI8_PHARH|nr:trnahis guanylyltransferase [Phaffia rhodozyma]